MAGTSASGTGGPNDPQRIALARMRQLAAHELGHTLGLGHNFAASAYGRASVMDYPSPRIRLDSKENLDFSDAYAVGIGPWDVQAIRYTYTQFPPGADEAASLDRIVREGLDKGMFFLTDRDARDPKTSHPLVGIWDDGADPAVGLREALRVRRVALNRFGQGNLHSGESLSRLEEILAPVYLYHRYMISAAVKSVGGMEYRYMVKGDGQTPTRMVSAAQQRQALSALLDCISPETLDLPDSVLTLLTPHPSGMLLTPIPAEMKEAPEAFSRQATSPAFDALGTARFAADLVVSNLLNPQRCARLVDFHRRDSGMPDLEEVLGQIISRSFSTPPQSQRHVELQRTVQNLVVMRMIQLAAHASTTPAVRARVSSQLSALQRRLDGEIQQKRTSGADTGGFHEEYLARLIRQSEPRLFTDAQLLPSLPFPHSPPPGDPIGADGEWEEDQP